MLKIHQVYDKNINAILAYAEFNHELWHAKM